jgi:flavoprotein
MRQPPTSTCLCRRPPPCACKAGFRAAALDHLQGYDGQRRVGNFGGVYHTLILAPATPNTVAKCVCGISDNLATNAAQFG